MSGVEHFETERLVGSRITDTTTDLDRLRALYQDPDVAHWLGGARSDECVAARLGFELAHWEAHGFGAWIFAERGTGVFVGRGAVRHAQVLEGDQIELGYALLPDWWGRGFATEIAAALVGVARDRLGLDELAAWTMTTNAASRHVLEKVGFTYVRDFVHADLPHRYYRLRFGAPGFGAPGFGTSGFGTSGFGGSGPGPGPAESGA
jgi:[ribosomal protein S5]-alanine N-acetyltransferase